MDIEETKITIGNKMEMIQINGSLVNFHSEFKISSENGEPFSAIVINHKTLDELNEDNIEFKNAPRGIFAGEITENSNEPDSWYILVKSKTPINAALSVKTEEVSPAEIGPQNKPPKGGLSPLTIVIIIAVLLIIGFIVYKVFFHSAPVYKSETISYAAPAIIPSAPVVSESPLVVDDIDFTDLPSI